MSALPRFSFVLKIFLFLAICLSGSSVFSFYSLIYRQSDTTEPSIVLIEKGDSLDKIARRLKKDGLIGSVSVFKLAGRVSGDSTRLKAGEYRIPAKASPKLILDILTGDKTVVRRLTIPEGLTSAQTVAMLMDTAALFGEIADIPPNGALLPETYIFSYGTPRKVVFDRMREAMTKTIDELWPQRAADLPYATKEEALVMASIVEKETSVSAERPHIAGVFVNRLRKGMRLQTDPTVIYAVTNGSMVLKRALTYADLKKDHPFNTYTRKGLPPAPICNPGRESIAAALNPQKTKDLYFVANGKGGHAFAATFDGHRANIAAWKKMLQDRKSAKKAKTAAETTVAADAPAPQEEISEELISAEETLSERDGAENPVVLSETSAPAPIRKTTDDSAEKKQVVLSEKKVEKKPVSAKKTSAPASKKAKKAPAAGKKKK